MGEDRSCDNCKYACRGFASPCPWWKPDDLNKKGGCPPDYNPGFCYDDEDCEVCWKQWEEENKTGCNILPMNKWEKMREIIESLHSNNMEKPEVEFLTRYLLTWMKDLDETF